MAGRSHLAGVEEGDRVKGRASLVDQKGTGMGKDGLNQMSKMCEGASGWHSW